jgi:2-succinyl-6-hydroxy-2,4-cyclohexadiene-1-carboxylate synthase
MPKATPPSTQPQAPRPAAVLHAEAVGNGPRLVMAHGFTQTGRVWGSLDRNLAVDHQVVLIDMPGHAASSEVAANLVDGAHRVADVGGRATYLGYSMGARFCLHLALARPELVDGLVLISGTAGIDDPTERRARRVSDEALAEELDPIADPASTSTPVASFLRRWMDSPMFAGIGPEADGFEERLRNTGPGLASSLRLAGTGTQEPLWERIGGLAMPVLIITGERDEKFTALGRRMVDAIGPSATQVVVAGAGHAPHLQRPDEVAASVRAHPGRAIER